MCFFFFHIPPLCLSFLYDFKSGCIRKNHSLNMNGTMNHGECLVEVKDVSKKFSQDLKWSMIHGITDLGRLFTGQKLKRDILRKQEFWALSDVNLKLHRGEILSVLGNNGSGKTTLMRMISGIYPVDKGRIEVRGTVSSLFALRTGMHPHFTGRENIYVKAGMFGMSKEKLEEKIEWIISFSELGKFIDSPYGSYSSGMQSRLGYSIAAATEPDIFIIDEGLAVGDVSFRVKCFDHLKNISEKSGIIFITHNLKRIEALANNILILDHGKFVFESENITAGIEYYLKNCTKLDTRNNLD
jgi:lipopolysaccharide transport system ATP-binding protein